MDLFGVRQPNRALADTTATILILFLIQNFPAESPLNLPNNKKGGNGIIQKGNEMSINNPLVTTIVLETSTIQQKHTIEH